MSTDLTPEHTARRTGDNKGLHPEVAAAYRYVERVLDSADIPSSKLGGPLWFGWALREAFLAGCSYLSARTALAQPEPEGPPAVTSSALLHPAYEPDDGSADGAQMVGMAWWRPVMGCDSLQLVVDNARNILRSRWAYPAAEPVPVAERFEFSVFNSEYEEQAGGTAPTYAQALSEGQHYLSQYSQDGPHFLEIRRVEVLPHNALPAPGAEVQS